MNCFSWEKRIRRAEELARAIPESAELLGFYQQVARFQQHVYERLKAGAASDCATALEQEYPPLLRLIQRIGPAPLAARAVELQEEPRPFAEVMTSDCAPTELQFFARVLLQPYMEDAANRHRAPAKELSARCPMCGESPVAAVLRGEGGGGKRWLVCSLCSNEWEFWRILCPACGEEDKELLPVYTTALFEHVRVEACDRCRTYIKAVDLTRNGLAVPSVDEIASVALDIWAAEAGLKKLQCNILRL
jgi:FdhE protein